MRRTEPDTCGKLWDVPVQPLSRSVPVGYTVMLSSRGPPPALTSNTYSEALNEIKSLGVANSTTATTDEALTGRFWNGAIQNYWNEIAQTATLDRDLTTGQSARLFALLNLALADGVIAFYDAKYIYNLWRPVTAIRAAET